MKIKLKKLINKISNFFIEWFHINLLINPNNFSSIHLAVIVKINKQKKYKLKLQEVAS